MNETSRIPPELPASSVALSGPISRSARDPMGLSPAYGGYGIQEQAFDYSTVIRRHRLAIAVFFILFGAGGILYGVFAPRSYRAECMLEITGINPDFMDIRTVNPNADRYTADSYLDTQVRLLRNEAILNRVVAVIAPTVPGYIADPSVDDDKVVRKMLRSMHARVQGGSNLVKITLDGPDPRLVARTANELAKQYVQEEEDARLSAALSTGTFLTTQLSEARTKLQTSENALQEYARASGIVLTDDKSTPVATEHLKEIQQGLAQAELERAKHQAQVETAQYAPVEAVPQVADDPTIRADLDKLRDLRMQLADLGTTMTPANYRVERLQAQIRDLEGEMRRQRDLILNRLTVENREAARRQALLEHAYQRQIAIVTDQGAKQVRYNMLRHEVDVNRAIYQSIIQKVQDAGIMAAMRAASARVVSPATAPSLPHSPNLPISLGLGLLLASASSMLYVLTAERRNRKVRAPGESELYVARPELGVIPKTKIVKVKKGCYSAIGISAPMAADPDPMLRHWNDGGSSFMSEAFRIVMTSILFSRSNGLQPRVLVVTSPHPQCGKTVVTANLAICLAEAGRRILLVEADLRRPDLAKLFQISSTTGLATMLSSGSLRSLKESIRSTPYSGVYVLPAGNLAQNAAKLLQSEQLPTLFGAVREMFDFVLIDTPPILGIADARILARLADGAIMICRANRTHTSELDEARRLLVEDNIHIIGTILNAYDLQHERPSYYRTYSHYLG